MKKSFKLFSLFLLVFVCTLSSCRSKQEVSSSYSMFKFDTFCVNNNGDGTFDLRVWGSGVSRDKAIEQAMKNAVSDVIFKGIKGDGDKVQRPLVTEVNARERYQDYFDRFFANGGEYKNFINETSNKDGSRIQSKSNSRENYSVIVTIDRSALRRQLQNDGIIN